MREGNALWWGFLLSFEGSAHCLTGYLENPLPIRGLDRKVLMILDNLITGPRGEAPSICFTENMLRM